MDIVDAIDRRVSCRAFSDKPLDEATFNHLVETVARINEESGFNFQLYGPRDHSGDHKSERRDKHKGGYRDEHKGDHKGDRKKGDGAFPSAITMNTAMFASNPPCYAALVAPKDALSEEKLGYYGERLVLEATRLGLGTCWVASTYDKKTTRVRLEADEILHDVIPIGYAAEKTPLKQRTIRKAIRGRSKKMEDLFKGPMALDDAPEWIQACILAVWKAPSAINEQPVVFTWEGEGSPVKARLAQVKTGLEYTDLGIAKYHFEVTAEACGMPGTWQWGDGGAFV